MSVRFLTQQPPELLRDSVHEFWLLEDDGGFHAGLPKPYVEIVISLSGRHLWRAMPDGEDHLYTSGWITPLQDGPRYAQSEGPRRLVGARLMPHAATAMFGALPRGDGTPPLHLLAVIGPEMEALRQSLQEAPSPSVLFSLFGDWLMTRPGYGERWAVPADEDRAQILAERMGISIRSLRRLFARDIGLAPKRLLQLNRLNAVLQDPDLLSSAVPLAELAGKHGFADQAHMTRQISRLTGATPHELRGRNPSNPPHMRDEVAGLFNSGSPG